MYTYTIDPVLGSDRNDGSPAAPLKTHREFVQRTFDSPPSGLGKGRVYKGNPPTIVLSGLQAVIGVNIIGDLPPTDPIDVDVTLLSGTLLAYVGTPRLIRSGTLTAGTIQKDRNTNTPQQLQDTVTPFTAADIGRRIRIVGGPRDGQYAWGAALLAGNILRTSSFSTPTMTNLPDDLISTGLTTLPGPLSGDNYVVEEMSLATIRDVNGRTADNAFPTIGFANFEFRNVSGPNDLVSITPEAARLNFKSCKWNGQMFLADASFRFSFLNCCSQITPQSAAAWAFGSAAVVRGGLSLGAFNPRTDSTYQVDDDFMCQGGPIDITAGVNLGAVCVFDSAIEGIRIGRQGVVSSAVVAAIVGGSGLFFLWGSGNGGAGVKAYGSSSLVYVKPPSPFLITGTGGDFNLAGAVTSRAWDETAGAYTALRANTWANLAATIGAGGFSDNAHNVERNAHVVLRG